MPLCRWRCQQRSWIIYKNKVRFCFPVSKVNCPTFGGQFKERGFFSYKNSRSVFVREFKLFLLLPDEVDVSGGLTPAVIIYLKIDDITVV